MPHSPFRHDRFRDSFTPFEGAENADHAAAKAQLERMLSSKSWRWTHWIRSLEAWFRHGQVSDILRPRKSAKTLTVIVPIYNAYEHVVRCIDSVLLHTDIDGVRVVLLNDASTDPRIAFFLDGIRVQHPCRVKVVHHEKNMGFLKTANEGFSLAKESDVILLNSDTIVGPHWAESLRSTAAQDEKTGSVTAISNNASIYSVLRDHFSENTDPRQIGLLAEQIFRAPGALQPRIPTGMGFCMFFTRDALKEIGFFDEIFSPGYAEENDWCQRAAKKGFHHYLDDRCFVYHVGHASMRDAGTLPKGASTIDAHEKLLQSRHPKYLSRIRAYQKSGVPERVKERIERLCPPGFPARRMHIAFLLHQPLSYAARGGVERHVLDLVCELKDTCDCTVISPHRGSFVALRFYDHLALRYELEYEKKGESKRLALLTFLRLLNPDVIHIQHLEGHGFALLQDMRSLGKKLVYSIHDSFATHVVPHPIVMHGKDDSRRSPEVLRDIATHFRSVDRFVAPSKEAAEDFLQCFPDFKDKTSVIEHGLLIGMRVPAPIPATPTVCFLGAIADTRKGRALICNVVPELLKEGIAVTFLGSIPAQFPSLDPSPLLRFSGTYDPADVVTRLRREVPSVVALFSLFPETYSFTAHEALAAGIPLFTTPVGVFPRLLKKADVGRTATDFDSGHILKELLEYLGSEDIKRHRKNTLEFSLMPRRRMAEEYYEIYRSLVH